MFRPEGNAPPGWVWKYSDQGDGWNDIHIVCRGTNIATTVNGVTAARLNGDGILNDADHRRHRVGLVGHIALQVHSGDELYIQYRDIYLKRLD